MRDDKDQAIELRKQGKSYAEIKEELGVPKSTLSDWLSPHGWSQNIKEQLRKESIQKTKVNIVELNKARGRVLEELYEQAEEEAKKEFERLKYHPLFMAGLMLYWGEGDRAGDEKVRLGNTDSEMLRVFVMFLTDVCQIPHDKLNAQVLVYDDLNNEKCREYWSEKIGVAIENFYKSSTLPSKHAEKRVPHGVCIVSCNSTYLKRKFDVWLRLAPKALLSKGYYKY